MKRFFVIGSPRSGTTLLRLMLNKNQRLSVPPEAGFLVWLYTKYKDFSYSENEVFLFVRDLLVTSKIEHWGISDKELANYIISAKPASYSELMDVVYLFYSKVKLIKNVEVFGDKNNFYLTHIELLHSLYNDAKFIHIIRDGRSVAVSYMDIMKKNINFKYAPKLPVDISDIANEWVSNINKVESSFNEINSNRYITVRFEDLILEPEKILKKICVFLDVKYDNEMLNYYQTTGDLGLEPSSFNKWKSKNLLPLQKDEVFKYKNLEEVSLQIFNDKAADILDKYGYMGLR